MDVNHSPDAARKVLQRGLRINEDSGELWIEYLKMELWFAEVVRRRRDVLGIERDREQIEPEHPSETVDIVKVVIQAALAKLNVEWKHKLKSTVATYPVPDTIRNQWLPLFQ